MRSRRARAHAVVAPVRHNKPPIGSRPGTLAIPADAAPTRIHVFEYSENSLRERVVDDPEELRPYLTSHAKVWVHVQGFADEAKLWKVAEVFSLHPLVLEDATNVPQRAKS